MMKVREEHISLRCAYCETVWPLDEEYLDCPRCQEPCRPSEKTPLLAEEAKLLANHANFGQHLLRDWLTQAVENC